MPQNLPDYVERGGRQVWRPPYRAHRATVFGFVLPCDRAAIDALLHRDLVEPSRGAVDYRCAQERMLVLFAAIERLTSAEDPDRLRGCVSELEASVWCLAADALAGNRLVWYLPYVFVDSGQAVASGREVYGYPKQMGVFEAGFPEGLASPGTTTVEAEAIDPYDPDQRAVLRPMLSATRAAGGGQAAAGGGAAAFSELLELLGEDLEVDELLPFGPGPQPSGAITPIGSPPPQASSPIVPPFAVRRVVNTMLGRGLTADPAELIATMVQDPTLVFLKQFRDVSCPTKACYQAVVEASLAVDPLSADYESLPPQLFEIAIEDWDSHPIATELGVPAATPLQAEAAFRARIDFDIRLGLEVWRAAT
jgi:hypothetical protein